MLHRRHGTTLIYTFSAYKDGRPLAVHLKEELEAKNFELKPKSDKEVMELLVAGEENRYIRKLLNLICRFISNFKVNGYSAEEFERMYYSTQNVRSRLFLEIFHECYLEYNRWLKENQVVDFEDMINESSRILREVKEMKQKLDFKYVIVDEYQDISKQRFDLTKALAEVTNAKIIAVGDDWQSIYAFSGSDITLFTKFAEKMGYAKLLKIVKTYRNSQEVIDIAGNFIQKIKSRLKNAYCPLKILQIPLLYILMIAHIKDAMEIEEAVLIMQWHMQLKKSWKSYLCIRKKREKCREKFCCLVDMHLMVIDLKDLDYLNMLTEETRLKV